MKTFYTANATNETAELLLALATADIVEDYMGIMDDEDVFTVTTHEGKIVDMDWYWEQDIDDAPEQGESVEVKSSEELLELVINEINCR